MCMPWPKCERRGNFQELVLSFCHVHPGNGTQLLSLAASVLPTVPSHNALVIKFLLSCYNKLCLFFFFF